MRHPKLRILRRNNAEELQRRVDLGEAEPYLEEGQKLSSPRQVLRQTRSVPLAAAKDSYGELLNQRQFLRELYGVRTASALAKVLVRWWAQLDNLRCAWKGTGVADLELRSSPLYFFEARAEVVLHRSGLVNSIAHARQLIDHGFIYWTDEQLYGPEEVVAEGERSKPWQERKVRWEPLNHTHQVLQGGQRLKIHRSGWETVLKQQATTQWKAWPGGEGRSVPSYLEVDYDHGVVSRWATPRVTEVLLPRRRTPNSEVARFRR